MASIFDVIESAPGRCIVDHAAADRIYALTYGLTIDNPARLQHYERRTLSPLTTETLLIEIAHQYLVSTIPDLHLYEPDVVLSWAEILEDSLTAYRAKVHELLADSRTDLFSPEGEALVRNIGQQLDVQYADLLKQVYTNNFWKQCKERRPHLATVLTASIPTLYIGGTALQTVPLLA